MVDIASDQFAQNLILDLIPTRKDFIGHSYADTWVGKLCNMYVCAMYIVHLSILIPCSRLRAVGQMRGCLFLALRHAQAGLRQVG